MSRTRTTLNLVMLGWTTTAFIIETLRGATAFAVIAGVTAAAYLYLLLDAPRRKENR